MKQPRLTLFSSRAKTLGVSLLAGACTYLLSRPALASLDMTHVDEGVSSLRDFLVGDGTRVVLATGTLIGLTRAGMKKSIQTAITTLIIAIGAFMTIAKIFPQ